LILLDTNTVIQYIKGLNQVVERVQAVSRNELRIPSVVAYELEYGALHTGSVSRRRATEAVLATVPQISFDAAAASEAVHIRLDLERRGLMIGYFDILIAGSAVSRGALLVTNNTAEFSRVRGLRLQDWTK
jgi:tRNA(fMet)-specific endonuclease VapC